MQFKRTAVESETLTINAIPYTCVDWSMAGLHAGLQESNRVVSVAATGNLVTRESQIIWIHYAQSLLQKWYVYIYRETYRNVYPKKIKKKTHIAHTYLCIVEFRAIPITL